jgi:hypothetical protein
MEQTMKLTANKISKDISDAIDTRLNELNDTAKDTRQKIIDGQRDTNDTLSRAIERMAGLLSELGGSRRSSYY